MLLLRFLVVFDDFVVFLNFFRISNFVFDLEYVLNIFYLRLEGSLVDNE